MMATLRTIYRFRIAVLLAVFAAVPFQLQLSRDTETLIKCTDEMPRLAFGLRLAIGYAQVGLLVLLMTSVVLRHQSTQIRTEHGTRGQNRAA